MPLEATLLAISVPSFDPVGEGNSPTVTGSFNLDLLNVPGVVPDEQTYFLYAFSGKSMAGPVPVALVSESRVR